MTEIIARLWFELWPALVLWIVGLVLGYGLCLVAHPKVKSYRAKRKARAEGKQLVDFLTRGGTLDPEAFIREKRDDASAVRRRLYGDARDDGSG